MKKSTTLILGAIVLVILFLYAAYNGNNKTECARFSYFECPSQCVVCPPCETCSSLVCQTEDYCAGVGFNRSWYEQIRPGE